MALRLWGSETTVNTNVAGGQNASASARLQNGGYIVVWQDLNAATGDGNFSSIKMQRFDAFGVKTGGETLVNTVTVGSQNSPDVLVEPNGTIWIAWTDQSNIAGNGTDVRFRRFSSDGTPLDAADRVALGGGGTQASASLTRLANGDIVFGYQSANATNSNTAAHRFDAATGNVVGGIVNFGIDPDHFENDLDVAALNGGSFVGAWHDSSANTVRFAMYNGAGVQLIAPRDISSADQAFAGNVSTAALANGGFVVSWRDERTTGPDTDLSAVHAQVFSASGAEIGAEIVVNSVTAGDQENASVAALGNGGFVVVYESGDLIRAQAFDAAGARQGAEIIVGETGGVHTRPAISALRDGRLIVTWTVSEGGDIRQRILDPRDGVVTGTILSEQLIGHDTDADTISGFAGNDTLSGLGGNDILIGGAGGDVLDGGAGSDTVSYAGASARVRVALDGSIAFEGDALGDTFVSIASVNGTSLGDVIFGDAAANTIRGGGGSDTLRGLAGNDNIQGESGNDALTGGPGDDTFAYGALSHGGDTITDFGNASGNNDVLRFTGSAFGNLAAGALDPARFVANAAGAATASAHRFVYETDTGVLSFDSNGSGAGGVTVIATLTGAPTITAADFLII